METRKSSKFRKVIYFDTEEWSNLVGLRFGLRLLRKRLSYSEYKVEDGFITQKKLLVQNCSQNTPLAKTSIVYLSMVVPYEHLSREDSRFLFQNISRLKTTSYFFFNIKLETYFTCLKWRRKNGKWHVTGFNERNSSKYFYSFSSYKMKLTIALYTNDFFIQFIYINSLRFH